jgi:methylmalonyl-CoA mutase
LGEAFEDLRDRSDARLAASGSRPRVFLCCLGSAADHGGRLGFARGLFAAGGIEAVESGPLADMAGVADACRGSDACLAALCATDEALEQSGPAAISALKAAGCERIWVMGRPASVESALSEAGAAGCVRSGDDILAVLEDAYAFLDENP